MKNILQACTNFYKLAQQSDKLVIDPKKKNIDFWSNFLYNAIKSYAQKFASPFMAKRIFDNIAVYNASPSYQSSKEAKDIDAIDTAMQEASGKLKAAGVDPVAALQQKGMSKLNPDILNILHNNLTTIREAKNFNAYKHYYLQMPGEPKEIIEIDEADNDLGY